MSSNVQVKIKRSILKADKMSFKLHGNIVGAIKNIVKRKKFNLVIFQLDDIGRPQIIFIFPSTSNKL